MQDVCEVYDTTDSYIGHCLLHLRSKKEVDKPNVEV
jgi:hypothetical protein